METSYNAHECLGNLLFLSLSLILFALPPSLMLIKELINNRFVPGLTTQRIQKLYSVLQLRYFLT